MTQRSIAAPPREGKKKKRPSRGQAACLERMQEKLMEEERGLRAVLKGRVTASYSAVHDALRALASEVLHSVSEISGNFRKKIGNRFCKSP